MMTLTSCLEFQLFQIYSHPLICLHLVVCGAENEVAPIPEEDDYYALTNRKLDTSDIVSTQVTHIKS